MLDAQGLRKDYGAGAALVTAVAGVSLEVGAGEFVTVTGRSGSGKSTLLAMLGGLARPSAGRVIVGGVDPWSLKASERADFRALRVGFILQLPGLLPSLRAVDNVALPALLGRRGDLAAAYARAETLLGEVGLAGRGGAYPGELSGGEQRRVALARALVNDPPLILADEPTADLDEETEREVVDRLVDLHGARGTTLVLVTHRADVARRADRIVRLRAGRVEGEDIRPSPEVAPPSRPVIAPAPRAAAAPAAPLGAGLRRFAWSFVAWTIVVVAAILALDVAVAALQHRDTTRRQAARNALQRVALQQLRAGVEDVAADAAGGYRLTLALQNLEPGRDLFVLGPAVRVFVQADRGWTEVPSGPLDEGTGGVVRVGARHRAAFTFTPDVAAFEQQIAGYYHVRITSTMLVSRRREPGDDLFERTDAYYVYLKPRGADDADLRRRNGWSGTPPAWIPMPPH